MTFQEFVTTKFGTRLWMNLGRWLPPRFGHLVAHLTSGVLARRTNSSLYRTIYANQSHVLGAGAGPDVVHRATRALLRHAGVVSFDLMHVLAKGENAIGQAMEFSPQVWADINASRAGGRGAILCGVHLSNFNLALLAMATKDLPLQILSLNETGGGFQILQDLRSRGMLEETPVSSPALRAAIRRLHNGGIVGTGVDWPELAWEAEMLPFFGHPAPLPTGHIRLAITTNARLLPVACRWDPARGYYVQTASPLELELTGDRVADVRHNALRVLAVLERWIAECPSQWLMYRPVWGNSGLSPATGRIAGRASHNSTDIAPLVRDP